jgi:lysophospholipase L1-like esterase
MKSALLLLSLVCFFHTPKEKQHMYTYLALGDSYTIGEQVPASENFPHQTVKLLRAMNVNVTDPVIIATTGWTTDELATAIREHNITDTFSIVSLLIGVNNQYRGRSVENYREEYTQLLNQSLHFAGGNARHVFVLSIPDWGVTPFAEGRDRKQIAEDIDAYNAACKEITEAAGCHYIEITESTRAHGLDAAWLAADGLHPSGREYAAWAERLANEIDKDLTR